MKFIPLLLLIYYLTSFQTVYCQVIGDTVLSLLHEPGKNFRGELSQLYPEDNIVRMETVFAYNKTLFDGYPLELISYKREINTQTLLSRQLVRLPVVTADQLNSFLKASYPQYGRSYGYEGSDYFYNMKKIYIVECTSRRKATVTEVVWNITRE